MLLAQHMTHCLQLLAQASPCPSTVDKWQVAGAQPNPHHGNTPRTPASHGHWPGEPVGRDHGGLGEKLISTPSAESEEEKQIQESQVHITDGRKFLLEDSPAEKNSCFVSKVKNST